MRPTALAACLLVGLSASALAQPAPGGVVGVLDPAAAAHRRARSTPILNQHTGGGKYPGSYCMTTALRMVLRLEGVHDPGADIVALRGARPFISAKVGSDIGLLARRARELGLSSATYTQGRGKLVDIVRMIDAGRAVVAGGVGLFVGKRPDGTEWRHSYKGGHYVVVVGYERGPDGRVKRLVVNDPDRGARFTMEVRQALTWMRGDGWIRMLTY